MGMPEQSVLEEANELINGERAAEYGDALTEADKIIRGWEVILGLEPGSMKLTAPALCMTWLKIVRETNRHKRDNIVDAAGYLGLAEKVTKVLYGD